MKRNSGANNPPYRLNFNFTRAFIIAGFLLGATSGGATIYTPLNSWSFTERTNWTSDNGYAPVSFTNLDYSHLGNGASLVVNSTNAAWLQFNVAEPTGATNLTVDVGTVMFWFAPNWSGTNQGGTGAGEYGRLLEVGGYTLDSSFGWWSLYVDDVGNNIYFSAQTNDLSSNVVTYLSAPISWTTNYFHFIALTYSATNTALYLDGSLVTNGTALTVYPGADALAKGFFIGSDSNGVLQANGLFNSVATYRVPLDADTIRQIFKTQYTYYILSPWNMTMSQAASFGGSAANLPHPSSSPSYFNVISGAGFLQYLGASANCFTSSNVWMTNVSASVASQPITFNFDIAGGFYGSWYDVFAFPALTSPITNAVWMGQGATCNRYSLANLPTSNNVFFILGTPLDSDGDGLTDAYERLVSHSDPYKVDTDGGGMPDGWQVLHFGKIGNNRNSDPDQDGLYNYQEYLYGTDPQVSEGFAVWVSSPN